MLSAVILFVVGDDSFPVCDHRGHEFGIYKVNPHVTVLRRTYADLAADRGHLNEDKTYFV